jgi:hypothetical protein
VAFDAISGHEAGETHERLHDAPAIGAGFAPLERRLMTRLHETNGVLKMCCAIAEITRQQNLGPIPRLSETLGVSPTR